MATVEIKTIENKSAGSLDLAPGVFEAPVRKHLFHAEVRRQTADRRRGTHSTKNRTAVSGGGAKPWRQKGTGRARQGTTRAPQWQGGGVAFGPVSRSHAHRLPKKVRAAALRSALSMRLQENALTVVDGIALDAPKTKRIVEMLNQLGLGDTSVLIVTGERDEAVERSVRNLANAAILCTAGLNVYDVLNHNHLLMTKDAVEAVVGRLARSAGSEGAKS